MTKLFDRYLSLMEMTREQFFTRWRWYLIGFLTAVVCVVLDGEFISSLVNLRQALANLRG